MLADLDADSVQQASSEIGGQTAVFSGDLTKEGVCEELVRTAVDELAGSTSSSTTPATPGTGSPTR